MKFSFTNWSRTALATSAIAIMSVIASPIPGTDAQFVSGAHAHEDGEGGGGQGGGGGGQGGGGQGGSGGHDDGGCDNGDSCDDDHGDDHDGGHGGGGSGTPGGPGQGGSNGEGPGGNGQQGPGEGSGGPSGNRPIWAGEGLPPVELGRMNVLRSPTRVVDRAYLEALATLTPEMVAFYNQPLDRIITDLSQNWDSLTRIDSPLQNLALMQSVLNGQNDLSARGITNSDATLLAVFLGTASDKGIPITTNTVIAVTILMGSPMDAASAASLAAAAEAVRLAIVEGHG